MWLIILIVLAAAPDQELVNRAESIVHGRVSRSWPAWDAQHKYIWTHYEVQALDILRGNRGLVVIVSEPGGSLDGISMRVSETLDYAVGEEALLFLYRTPAGHWRALSKQRATPEMKSRIRRMLAGRSQ
ncbi:MAG: hypothetical protein HYR60_01525 [Acidobacteria bacterium]|nr:hypothetical protein [Acidobacteriota bacterium]